MFNIYNFYSNDLEIFLSIILINIFSIIIYDKIKSQGKLYFNIIKTKLNILNKNNWANENLETNSDTKALELDFILQLYNHKNTHNSLYDLEVKAKEKPLINNYLNLSDTMKSISGATTYEKLKYVNLLPFEIKEFHIKIKITKEEFQNMKKNPLYITYKNGNKKKKIKLNKYLQRVKK